MTRYASLLMVGAIVFCLLMCAAGVKLYLYLRKNTGDSNENKLIASFNRGQSYLLLLFVIIFLMCVTFSTFYFSRKFLPDPAATPGSDIKSLFNTTTLITGTAFFITQGLLFFFAFKFRNKHGQKAKYITGQLKLEFIWTLVPAVTFIFLFIWGQILWAKVINKPQGEALEIEVMGEQFNWRVRYPGLDHKLGRSDYRFITHVNDMGIDAADPNSKDDFIPIQMHVPKNRPVVLKLRSKDVIHSFFIPFFRTKMDAVPGMTTQMHFTPTVTTDEMRKKLNEPDFDYEVACAELCGRMHFGMKLILVVDEPDQFERWYASQVPWTGNSLASK